MRIAGAVLLLAALVAAPAQALTPEEPAPTQAWPHPPSGRELALRCAFGGTVAALFAWRYSLGTMAVSALSLASVPALAGAFAAGCAFGALTAATSLQPRKD